MGGWVAELGVVMGGAAGYRWLLAASRPACQPLPAAPLPQCPRPPVCPPWCLNLHGNDDLPSSPKPAMPRPHPRRRPWQQTLTTTFAPKHPTPQTLNPHTLPLPAPPAPSRRPWPLTPTTTVGPTHQNAPNPPPSHAASSCRARSRCRPWPRPQPPTPPPTPPHTPPPPPRPLTPQAVAADTDYYGRAPQLFAELTSVLRALGLLPGDDVTALETMAAEVEAVRSRMLFPPCSQLIFIFTAGGHGSRGGGGACPHVMPVYFAFTAGGHGGRGGGGSCPCCLPGGLPAWFSRQQGGCRGRWRQCALAVGSHPLEEVEGLPAFRLLTRPTGLSYDPRPLPPHPPSLPPSPPPSLPLPLATRSTSRRCRRRRKLSRTSPVSASPGPLGQCFSVS